MAIKTRTARMTGTAISVTAAILLAACSPQAETAVEPVAPAAPAPGVGAGDGAANVGVGAADGAGEGTGNVTPTELQCSDVTGTVNFRWWGGEDRAARQLQALDIFQTRYPGITVNPMPTSWDGFWAGLQVEALAGNQPDVFPVVEAWLAPLISAGALADLTHTDMDLSAFSDAMLGSAKTDAGAVYAYPVGGNAQGIAVNVDVLDAAGIPLPDDSSWSWDDLLNTAAQVTQAGLTTPNGAVYGMSGFAGDGAARLWANQTDGGMFTADGQLNWSDESILEWMETNERMVATGASASPSVMAEAGASGQPGDTLMAQGRVAFQGLWVNQLPTLANLNGANMQLLRFPGDFTPGNNIGTWLNPGMFMAMSSNAQSPEAAACLMDFMANDPESAVIMGIDRGVPFQPDMAAVVEPTLDEENAKVAAFLGRISEAGVAPGDPLPELSEDLHALIVSQTESVLFNVSTPEVAANSLRDALQGAIVN